LANFNLLPQDRALARQVVASRIRQEEQQAEMGALGSLIGTRHNAPVSIAAIISFLFVILIGAALFVPLSGDISRLELIKTFGGFLFTALGFLFGSLSGGGRS